jgi:SAM-dependent methyltransferase
MKKNTLKNLRCPSCHSNLKIFEEPQQIEISYGTVQCINCSLEFPILAGVLILVKDLENYFFEHIAGISRFVSLKDIPKKLKPTYQAALREYKNFEEEHIAEHIESERINALYLITHFAKNDQLCFEDLLLKELVEKHWNENPFQKIKNHLPKNKSSLLELGCSVGGLLQYVHASLESYLGVDNSFTSVFYARHFNLGVPLHDPFLIPADLIHGAISKTISFKTLSFENHDFDFIVCDLSESNPIKEKKWNFCAALNVIDMLPQPAELPQLQSEVLVNGGIAIQSSPYIWHPTVARNFKANKTLTSDQVVESLYKDAGFHITKNFKHCPWLFYKNLRQIELYSVHLFFAEKT